MEGGLFDCGGRVVSVFGAFGSRTLVEMPTQVASELFGDVALGECSPRNVVDATQRDLDAMPVRLAASALAATALAMAREIEHPYNSATSKSMCAGKLMDALDRFQALAPDVEDGDDLDNLRDAFSADSGGAAT